MPCHPKKDDEFDKIDEQSDDEMLEQIQQSELEDVEQNIDEEAVRVPEQPWGPEDNINEARTRTGRHT